jgi:hypothetical protein
MRLRFMFAVGLLLIAAVASSAQEPIFGTWNLDEARSKISGRIAKYKTVRYEASGNMIKGMFDGTGVSDQPVRHEWIGKLDGKFYQMKGEPEDPNFSRSYRKVRANNLAIRDRTGTICQKPGLIFVCDKIVATGTITVAADGKSHTMALSGTDSDGKRFRMVAVYHKQ